MNRALLVCLCSGYTSVIAVACQLAVAVVRRSKAIRPQCIRFQFLQFLIDKTRRFARR